MRFIFFEANVTDFFLFCRAIVGIPAIEKRMTVKNWKREFVADCPTHLYQASCDWGLIFYSDIDLLEYYMIQSVKSREYGVTVLAAAYMLNHLHSSCSAHRKEQLSGFVGDTTKTFAIGYNKEMGRKGSLFKNPFGSDPKLTEKDARSNFNYILNNAPEKKICKRAIDYRWDFLAYADNDHPFSQRFHFTGVSDEMRMAVSVVKRCRKADVPLTYDQLHTFKSVLKDFEWKQLMDIIITEYKFIRYDLAAEYFGGLENLKTAPDSNTGSEYNLKEKNDCKSYIPYYEMIKKYYSLGYADKRRSPFAIDIKEKNSLVLEFDRLPCKPTFSHISSFLHMDIEEVRHIIKSSGCTSWNPYY